MKHRSDQKHASTARARAEDKEKEGRKDAKVAEDELWLAREELQAVRSDLWAKMAALEQARQEALEACNCYAPNPRCLLTTRQPLNTRECRVT